MNPRDHTMTLFQSAARPRRRTAPAAVATFTAALAMTACEKEPPAPRPKLTDADRQTVAAEISALRAKADQADKERRGALDKAPAPSDDPSAPKCPVTIKQLLGEFEETDLLLHRTGINTKANEITELYPAPEWWHDGGRSRGSVDSGVGLVEIYLKSDSESYQTVADLLGQVRAVKLPDYVVTIVPEEAVKPVRLGTEKFEGGLLKGRAYLWSERERRLICGARVEAESSNNVKTFSGGNAGLLIDLIASGCIVAAYRFTVLPEAPPKAPAAALSSQPRAK